MKVRTRFAPSPTGALHAGTVRTALFAWLAARHADGQFILRIEDTDKDREVKNGLSNIVDSLAYLGIDWDEGPDKGGSHGPYTQSQRLALYKQWAEKLIAAGRAYADPYTKEEVDEFRKQAAAQKKPFLFRNHRPDSPPAWTEGQPLRFQSEPRAYKWHDAVMGELSTGPEVVDDFVLIKADGYPTYNFAHIIDDHLMEITHVIRSQEFISSMPIFLNLYDALELKWPVFATVPNVLDPDGKKKLSKRAGAKQLLEYRQMGILPQALMSVLATTGWNDGTEQEIFHLDELIKKFELNRVQRSGAKFDEQRLLWVNGHFIRELELDELYKLSATFWPDSAKNADENYKKDVLALVQERLKYLAELPELTSFFFEEPKIEAVRELFENPSDKQLKKLDEAGLRILLEKTGSELEQSNFSLQDIETRLNGLLETLNTKPGILFAAVRIAVTGSKSSPQLFGTLSVLGKQKSLARLDQALSTLDK